MIKANKRFPADTKDKLSIELNNTFLTNKEVDGEMYAYFQGLSEPFKNENGIVETRVYKKDLDTAKYIGELLGISQPTYRKRLNLLISNEYLIDKGNYYFLPNQEDFFFMLPLDSLQFLLDVVKTPVIKTLVYLGHQYEWKRATGKTDGYVFTLEELAKNLGIKLNNHAREYARLNNYLDALEKFGFIKYSEFYDGKIPKKRLYYFNKERDKLNEKNVK